MKKLDLSKLPCAGDFFKRLVEFERKGGRVYTTPVIQRPGDTTKRRFVTTSKDLHLGLGMFDAELRANFAELLEFAFKEAGGPEYIVEMPPGKDGPRKCFFVTRTGEEGRQVSYTISPA